MKNSLDYLEGLSAKLQRTDVDVFGAYTMIYNIQEIQCLRDDIGLEFQKWYDEAKQPTSYIGNEKLQGFSVISRMYDMPNSEVIR